MGITFHISAIEQHFPWFSVTFCKGFNYLQTCSEVNVCFQQSLPFVEVDINYVHALDITPTILPSKTESDFWIHYMPYGVMGHHHCTFSVEIQFSLLL